MVRAVAVRDEVVGDGAASRHVGRVALRFGDERRRAIERRRLDQRGRHDDRGGKRPGARPQQPDPRSGQRGARGDQRHVVPNAKRMTLHVGVAGERRGAGQREDQRQRGTRSGPHERVDDERGPRVRGPDQRGAGEAVETLAHLRPRDERMTERFGVLGHEEAAADEPGADGPPAVDQEQQDGRRRPRGELARRRRSASRTVPPRRSSTAPAIAIVAAAIGQAS